MRTLLAIVIACFWSRGRRPGRAAGVESRPRALTAFMVIWFVLCVVDTALGVFPATRSSMSY